MSYDRGDWHSDTCHEQGLPEQNAATHIALYGKWYAEFNTLGASKVSWAKKPWWKFW